MTVPRHNRTRQDGAPPSSAVRGESYGQRNSWVHELHECTGQASVLMRHPCPPPEGRAARAEARHGQPRQNGACFPWSAKSSPAFAKSATKTCMGAVRKCAFWEVPDGERNTQETTQTNPCKRASRRCWQVAIVPGHGQQVAPLCALGCWRSFQKLYVEGGSGFSTHWPLLLLLLECCKTTKASVLREILPSMIRLGIVFS